MNQFSIVCLGRENMVHSLIENNADTNVQDVDGKTPLHYASDLNYDKIVRILISPSDLQNNTRPQSEKNVDSNVPISSSDPIDPNGSNGPKPQNESTIEPEPLEKWVSTVIDCIALEGNTDSQFLSDKFLKAIHIS